MGKNNNEKFDYKKFNYKRAEADLLDAGACLPEEIRSYRTEESIKAFLDEHDLSIKSYYKPSKPEKKQSDGCYLTTACVTSRGLPDHCRELQTLRAFRDGYLAKRVNGREEIADYYRMAPGIVAAINQRPDASEIWNDVYDELVVPCVRMIGNAQNEDAYLLYKSYSTELEKKYSKN